MDRTFNRPLLPGGLVGGFFRDYTYGLLLPESSLHNMVAASKKMPESVKSMIRKLKETKRELSAGPVSSLG